MTSVPIALKRLTRNDVSWIEPRSNSHQSGINLPIKSFAEMFSDVISGKENVPRKKFTSHWYFADGSQANETEIEIAFYKSKSELRILKVPKKNTRNILREKNLLLIRRDEKFLHITHLIPNSEHLIKELGLNYLVDILPK